MTTLVALGTYLPPWGSARGRVTGPDEDALTLAVAAARAALGVCGSDPDVRRVVFVTRELPLLVGGNSAALLAGIGLGQDVAVVEQVGGAPAVFDALADAAPGTLVVAADAAAGQPAGAAAALVGAAGAGAAAQLVGRVVRSLPVHSRAPGEAAERDYADPRLQRELGAGRSLDLLDLPEKPVAVAGLPARQAAALCAGAPPALPTSGASAALFAIAALEHVGSGGLLLAVEQASVTALRVDAVVAVRRDEPAVQAPERMSTTPGPEIVISLAAYERAFDAKLRWEAGACDACGTLALPPRRRCLTCGSEAGWSLTPLPRTGEVYSAVTVHVPVPGLPTPYSLAIVQLDGVDVRALVKVTGAVAGSTEIGDRGRLVLRRVAVRSGVPDYGYALFPDPTAPDPTAPDPAVTDPTAADQTGATTKGAAR